MTSHAVRRLAPFSSSGCDIDGKTLREQLQPIHHPRFAVLKAITAQTRATHTARHAVVPTCFVRVHDEATGDGYDE
jgi:hypothetical protein